uniref:Nuclear envelope phosphatase-regulatory subunit 1 n=1 Tax=Pygocentrus nattereri TaxID=42514 RepID=A0AAR2L419_PYGNA
MDLKEYFKRIGFTGLYDKADLPTLCTIHKLHVMTVPFENLSIHCGEKITMDLKVIYKKIVLDHRGGWCCENNLLFSWVLREMGYKFTRLGARVFNMLKNDFNPMDSHLINLVEIDDLKAFERRLTEYVSCLQPATGRWRMILIVVSVCTATGAWNWLIDPDTQKVSFFSSLWNHPFFTISCVTLIGLFFAGIHKRVVAPSIIAARCRTVLAEYNMSCDDTGKLILKPRPHIQ